MPRKRFEPNPNPLADRRSMLPSPESIKFRRRVVVVTEGRGNAWMKGNLRGWEGDAAIVHDLFTGATRTLSPEIWEWKSA